VGDDKIRKCTHAGCACPADPGSDYCSPQCQASNGTRNAQCPCTHEVCQPGQQATREGIPGGSYDPATRQPDKEKALVDDWGKSDKH
jgi:hypothetical protein